MAFDSPKVSRTWVDEPGLRRLWRALSAGECPRPSQSPTIDPCGTDGSVAHGNGGSANVRDSARTPSDPYLLDGYGRGGTADQADRQRRQRGPGFGW